LFFFSALSIIEFSRFIASFSVTAAAFAYTYLSCRIEEENHKDSVSVCVVHRKF